MALLAATNRVLAPVLIKEPAPLIEPPMETLPVPPMVSALLLVVMVLAEFRVRTLEELLEILTLAHLEVLHKPVIILNQEGYYDDLLKLFDRIVAEKFMHATIRGKYAVAQTVAEAFSLLDHWSHQPGDAKWYQTR